MTENWSSADLGRIFENRVGQGDRDQKPDPETIWSAVAGELPVDEIERLVEQMAEDSELAADWRIALEIHRAQTAEVPGVVLQMHRRWRTYLAAAAASIALLFLGGLFLFTPDPPETVYRGQENPEIRALIEPGAALPREQFVLRWTSLGDGTTYDLVVSDTNLKILAELRGLTESQVSIASSDLASIPRDGQVRWQVTATDREGTQLRSRTFETRVR